MIRRATARSLAPHLSSALIACALTVAILCGGRLLAMHLEERTIHSTAPRDFFIKNQGLAFERAAARAPDILLLYGSSELIDPIPNRASDFFSREPTGFEVCPVGKAGTTSLIILQKLGALGSVLHGQKIAISLSPSSFLTPAVKPIYAANFSLAAANGTLFGNALDLNLKTDIAKRMLQFPDTLGKDGLLRLAAGCLASWPSIGPGHFDGHVAAGKTAKHNTRFTGSLRSPRLHFKRRQTDPKLVATAKFSRGAPSQGDRWRRSRGDDYRVARCNPSGQRCGI